MTYCGQCGNPLQEGDRFCGACGASPPSDLQDTTATTPPTEEDIAPTRQSAEGYPPGGEGSSGETRSGRRGRGSLIVGAVAVLVLALGAGGLALTTLGGDMVSQWAADPEAATQDEATEGEDEPAGDEATDESTSAEETTPPQETDDQELGVGDSVEAEGVSVTLNDVRSLPETDFDDLSSDEEYLATDLTLENVSEETIAVSSLLEFVLKDGEGYSADQTIHTEQRQLSEGDIAPGERTSGEIVYEVPSGAEGLQLDFNPLGGETYIWSIGDLEAALEDVPEPSEEAEPEIRDAVVDYYEAVDREDWTRTYELLDSQSQTLLADEEWFERNQVISSAESIFLDSMDVEVTDLTSTGTFADVNVYRTFTDGTVIDRDTYFVYEDGRWKHRLTEEEVGFFRPDLTYDEFVEFWEAGDEPPIVEESGIAEALYGHYEARGRGDFEAAYSYFGPTYRSQEPQDTWVSEQETYDVESSTINSLEVEEAGETTATATVDVSFEDNTGTPRFLLTWSLVKEDGEWKLDELDSGEEL